MRVSGTKLIDKYVKRNKPLDKKFSEWVKILKSENFNSSVDLKSRFNDIDTITKNIYIFNIKSSRSLCMVYFEDNEIEICWVGNHTDYERKFNTKKKILKFIDENGFTD